MINAKEFNLNKLFEYDFCFLNDANLPFLFPENVCCIVPLHGNAAMPTHNKYAYASTLSFADVLLFGSLGNLHMTANGLSMYRQDYSNGILKNQKCENLKQRTYIRKTRICPVYPLKKSNFFHENNTKIFDTNKEEKIIGIMPTCSNVLPAQETSIYYHFDKLLTKIFENFTSIKIIFRPYPMDYFIDKKSNLPTTNITGLVEGFQKFKNKFPNRFFVDTSGQSSSEFFAKCDVLITDGSTGGVSFLLNKAMPPIYYLENIENAVVKNFISIQNNKVLFAHNPLDLVQKIKYCLNLNKAERIKYFQHYCKNDLFLDNDNVDTFRRLLNIKNKNSYHCGGGAEIFPLVNEQGKIIMNQ